MMIIVYSIYFKRFAETFLSSRGILEMLDFFEFQVTDGTKRNHFIYYIEI